MAEKSIDAAVTVEKGSMSVTTNATSASVLTGAVRVVWDDTKEAGDIINALTRAQEKVQEYMQAK